MTLVLTNVTDYGVVMAADDALVETAGKYSRVLHGATKLFAHYGCHCGMATWGAGELPHQNPASPPVALEFILKRFVGETQGIESVDTQVNGSWVPFVYQIANCDDPYAVLPVVRQFASRVVRPLGPFSALRDMYPIANGVVNAGYWVDALFDALVAGGDVTENSHLVPGNSMEKRQAFLGLVARSVSDTHLTMNLSRSIGPRVLTLGISSQDGVLSFRD